MQDAPTRANEPVQIAAFVDPDMKRALLVSAERNERTLSGEMRIAIKTHLALDQTEQSTEESAT
jgi:hypothetical protein